MSITMGPRGVAIPDGLGRAIEQGKFAEILAHPRWGPLMSGMRTYLPGARIPNLLLTPPDGIQTLSGAETVKNPTFLSDLMIQKGHYVWAACRALYLEVGQ